jgi:hypothetical protein
MSININNAEYILYFDSKIEGALRQLISYFDNGTFKRTNVVVLCRIYKKTIFYFKRELKKNGIPCYFFSKYKDLPSLKDKIVFYMFNAQSNCRITAYREAVHIFITHGESHKLASAKPITRIYDYIITAGEAGIDRFLKRKIFFFYDKKIKRLIKMGDTFIGVCAFKKNSGLKQRAVLYAPTWEGGVSDENYSSIDASLTSFTLIGEYCRKNQTDTVVVQPHPNTGHRDKRYLLYLARGINLLLGQGYKVLLVNWHKPFYWQLFIKPFGNFKFIKTVSSFMEIDVAFTDVSAMEVQLLNKNIPTFVFFTDTDNLMPDTELLKTYYKNVGIYKSKSQFNINPDLQQQVKDYYISFEDKDLLTMLPFNRLNWLKNFIADSQNSNPA